MDPPAIRAPKAWCWCTPAGHEGEQINDLFHGQSGGPVYRVIDANPERGEVVDRLELVGIIYNRVMDLVLARPPGLINADGTSAE
jgi:hypothetical protein